MNDALERLRAANPVPTLPVVGAAPIFDEGSQSQPRRWPRLRSRRLLVLAAGVIALAVGAAIAGAHSGLWWYGGSSPYDVQTSSATKLVEFKLTSGYSTWSGGTTIAMWRLPQDNGWVCYLIALSSSPPSGSKQLGEGSCVRGTPEVPPGVPLRVEFGSTGDSWLVHGQVNPSSGIAELELDSGSGVLPLSYANGWFLSELPSSGSGDTLPKGGPYVLIGRDSDGRTVARVDLEKYYARWHGPA